MDFYPHPDPELRPEGEPLQFTSQQHRDAFFKLVGEQHRMPGKVANQEALLRLIYTGTADRDDQEQTSSAAAAAGLPFAEFTETGIPKWLNHYVDDPDLQVPEIEQNLWPISQRYEAIMGAAGLELTDHDGSLIEYIAAADSWLMQALPEADIRLRPIHFDDPQHLREVLFPSTDPSEESCFRAGRALALLHGAGAPAFGAAPPGFPCPFILPLGLTVTPHWEDIPASDHPWASWIAGCQILPALNLAEQLNFGELRILQTFSDLAERLLTGYYDAPQPSHITTPAALVHGNLHSQTIRFVPADQVVRSRQPFARKKYQKKLKKEKRTHFSMHPEITPGPDQLFEHIGNPATMMLGRSYAHGGSAESDLAGFIGTGLVHEKQFFAGYEEVGKLAPGWEQRSGIPLVGTAFYHAVATLDERLLHHALELMSNFNLFEYDQPGPGFTAPMPGLGSELWITTPPPAVPEPKPEPKPQPKPKPKPKPEPEPEPPAEEEKPQPNQQWITYVTD